MAVSARLHNHKKPTKIVSNAGSDDTTFEAAFYPAVFKSYLDGPSTEALKREASLSSGDIPADGNKTSMSYSSPDIQFTDKQGISDDTPSNADNIVYPQDEPVSKELTEKQKQTEKQKMIKPLINSKPTFLQPPADTYLQALSSYFNTTTFAFANESHTASLRKWMELVYLRKHPIVAIDVEAWERSNKKLTEIGIAVYDPAHQHHLIMPRIRTLHIVVKEHKKMVNSRFVPNNKFLFNGGTSYEMTQKELRVLLNKILTHYMVKTPGVLVGHSLGGDISWLNSIGVKLQNPETVDTQKLYQLSRPRGGTLRGALRLVEIPHSNLHNAANDAYYTLLAALAYTDPAQRTAFGLDTFVEDLPPQDPKQRSLEKAAKKLQKFSDKAMVLGADQAPDLAAFTL